MRLILSLGLLLCCAAPAYADAPFHLHIDAPADADCPSAGAVARELASLLPQLVISFGGDTAADSPVATLSFNRSGDSYRVDFGDSHRSFVDASARCDDRARTVAVFLAMTLAPEPIEIAPTAPEPPLAPALHPPLAPLAPQIDLRPAPTVRFNPLLRASVVLWSASLAMTAAGLALFYRGAVIGSPKTACVGPSNSYSCYQYNDGSAAYANTGAGIAIAGAALGVAVALPLTIVGARKNRGLHRAAAQLRFAPMLSSTNAGLAAAGTF